MDARYSFVSLFDSRQGISRLIFVIFFFFFNDTMDISYPLWRTRRFNIDPARDILFAISSCRKKIFISSKWDAVTKAN